MASKKRVIAKSEKKKEFYKQIKSICLNKKSFIEQEKYVEGMYNAGLLTPKEYMRLDGIILDLQIKKK